MVASANPLDSCWGGVVTRVGSLWRCWCCWRVWWRPRRVRRVGTAGVRPMVGMWGCRRRGWWILVLGSTVDGVDAGGGAFGGVRSFQVTGRGGVPASGVGAVVVNVTVTAPVGAGYVTVFPAGDSRPEASNVNFSAGETVANSVVAKVGAGGEISVYASTGAEVLIDVLAYFLSGSDYSGLSPARLVDTRPGRSTVDGLDAGGGAFGGVRSFQVTGRGGVPASGVGAVVVNVTVTAPVGAGYVTVFPAGDSRPNASNVNFSAGETVANSVIAKVGAGGEISVYASTGAEVLIDVLGYFPSGSDYSACRRRGWWILVLVGRRLMVWMRVVGRLVGCGRFR